MRSDGLAEVGERTVARHRRRHVGLVVGAVTSAGATSLLPVGHTCGPDGPTPGPRTEFEIGSVTEVSTTSLLAEAVTRGELARDTHVREVLPEIDVPTRRGVAMPVEHLATHTAVLP